MSKPVKQMIARDYLDRLGETEDALLVSLRGVSSNDTNLIRARLAKKQIRVMIVRNNLARHAFVDRQLKVLDPLLEGQNALAFGAESVVDVAREIVDIVKDFPGVELKGACLDGLLFEGSDGVERLSKFPTREEAIGNVVTLIVSPGRNLMGSVLGPGRTLGGVIGAIKKKLEDGETIAKQN